MLTSPGVASPIRRTFDAMGTRIHVIAAPDSDVEMVNRAASTVERIFGSQEARFSRFRPDSELSRINANAGRWTQISRPFSEVTRLALTAAEHTGGLFDPTVLRALRAAGYERTFTEVLERTKTAPHEDGDIPSIRREARTLLIKGSISCGAWRTIELEDDRILMPRGAELDFGGIAKGWTVDLAAEAIEGLPWTIVDAGGDLRIVGTTPPEGLDIAVDDPEARGVEALRLRLTSGALATTSVTVRSWGPRSHHVIDPRTSLPAMTEVIQATVWADTCADAEVWSKAALLTGPPILDHLPASLVLASGEIVTNFVRTGEDPSNGGVDT
jgi:thiamine biosynthesis lipoprotein